MISYLLQIRVVLARFTHAWRTCRLFYCALSTYFSTIFTVNPHRRTGMRSTLNITFVDCLDNKQYQPDIERCQGIFVLRFDMNIAGLEEG